MSAAPVLACIDGGEGGTRALAFAIEEARRRGAPVRLLHVVPTLIADVPTPSLIESPSLQHTGARILAEAAEHGAGVAPDVELRTVLGTGSRVGAILAEARTAGCVVLGTRAWRASRRVTGSTTARVAGHAACPVYGVPASWRPGGGAGRVVVGVDESGGPATVLEGAFAEARARHADLVIVHAWRAPTGYEVSLASYEPDKWRQEVAQALSERIAPVGARNSDVAAQVFVEYERPVEGILRHAAGAGLIVVGRHRALLPWPHGLGSVAHGLLHAGEQPVEIVPVEEERAER